ncbi:secreted repeat protein with Y-X4-D motif [Kribbella steppae]|uniref:Secreted repeat protein with Y-X4-D motif n=1 Tax=Kribbella steppae TaxID=2512223 RepID=A0A4R2H3L7_9ACTN|nr:hypothetical protein [Kribbella steppae]TCO19744.1 secreted repeat protein with Y-X4-D motif [Kribbella steppae]
MKRFAFVVGTAVIGLSALTACGGSASGTSSQNTPSPSAPATAGSSSPATTAGPGTLSTASVGSFGKIVVDGTGRTLYVYDLDTKNPSKSNCDGSCATAWPPLPAGTGRRR